MKLAEREFAEIKALVFDKCRFTCSGLALMAESSEYGACSFRLNEKEVRMRVAKVTPKKIGQFVTLWKRNSQGITEPPNINDSFDLFVINARFQGRFGQFVFPKSVLYMNGIVSGEGSKGKRGIRVYPPWDRPVSLQAQKSQRWQAEFFLELNKTPDLERARELYR